MPILYPNGSTDMPIRGLMYFARLYEAYIEKHKLPIYGRSLVRLPMPQFIIFYNGRENQPDEIILKLSDAFVPELKGDEPVLECWAKILNINYGHNKVLLDRCRRLHDYSYFVAKVNTYLDNGASLNKAINDAVNHCIDENILADILMKCRSEVADMLLTEFDEKLYKKTIYNEGFEDGVEKTVRESIIKMADVLRSLNLPEIEIIRIISEKYSMTENDIQEILNK